MHPRDRKRRPSTQRNDSRQIKKNAFLAPRCHRDIRALQQSPPEQATGPSAGTSRPQRVRRCPHVRSTQSRGEPARRRPPPGRRSHRCRRSVAGPAPSATRRAAARPRRLAPRGTVQQPARMMATRERLRIQGRCIPLRDDLKHDARNRDGSVDRRGHAPPACCRDRRRPRPSGDAFRRVRRPAAPRLPIAIRSVCGPRRREPLDIARQARGRR
jgi:hypothetical protein